MTRGLSGDHELPFPAWPDRDIARFSGGSKTLKHTYCLSTLPGTPPVLSVPG